MKAIELTVRVPTILAIDSDFLESRMESKLPIEQAPERHFAKIGPYAYSSYSLPDMHPGQSVGVDDLMRLADSAITDHFSAQTKDGQTVSGDISMTLAFPIRVSLSGEDLRSTDYDFDVIGVKSTDKSDLLRVFTKLAEQERARYRDKVGLWRFLMSYLNPIQRRGILIYPGYQEQAGPDGVALQIGTSVSSTDATYQIP